MPRWCNFWFLLLAGLLLTPACGEPLEREFRAQGIPIINGDPDTKPAHLAVVAVYDGYALCTGTLISSRVVLTAAHCISGKSAGSFNILFGNNINTATTRRVSEVKAHPSYNSTTITNDIGLLRLSSDPPAGTTVIPHLPHSIGITQADVGKPLEFVGFGQTETGGVGVKMTVTNNLNWVCTSAGGCDLGLGRWASQNTICQDQSPGGPCSGDSGGPALVVRSGQEYVAGVTSYGDQNCSYYGCSTKVDEFESFISDFVGGVLGTTCLGSAECLSGFCVDGVCCESLCSGLCEACNLGGALGLCRMAPSGTPCPDGNLCNGNETCQLGQCLPGVALDCRNANRCSSTSCDPAVGCLSNPLPDGTLCVNGDVCDGEEACWGGICRSGLPLNCDDRDPCTQDGCQASEGCQHSRLPDGTSCGGGTCGPATCQGGMCQASDPAYCDDGNPCTRDWCDPKNGCMHEPLPEGYECGKCMMCQSVQCVAVEDCVPEESCGCQSGSGAPSSVWLLALLGLIGVLNRRR